MVSKGHISIPTYWKLLEIHLGRSISRVTDFSLCHVLGTNYDHLCTITIQIDGENDDRNSI